MYFKPHLEILSEAQNWVYPQLRNLKKHGFVLYGGTALALQLGQRQSVGFEFFLHERLTQKLLRDACPLLGDESLVTQIYDSENTVTFEISHPDSGKGTATISFFGNRGYGRVGEPRLAGRRSPRCGLRFGYFCNQVERHHSKAINRRFCGHHSVDKKPRIPFRGFRGCIHSLRHRFFTNACAKSTFLL